MAKKKKKKGNKAEIHEPNMFWRQAGAVLCFVIAIFLALGGFGAGGPLPRGLFSGLYWIFGMAAYLSPVAFLYFGALKFKTEDHKVPLGNFLGMIFLTIFLAGWLHVGFSENINGVVKGGYGGQSGSFLGGLVLKMLDPFPASILFFVLTMLATFFSFSISLLNLMRITDLFRRKERGEEEEDMAKLSAASNVAHNLKVNAGVEFEHNSKPSPIKNTAQKLTKEENHAALTTSGDPDWEFPSIDLLNQKQDKADPGDVDGNAATIKETLAHFNIEVEMDEANVGPRVTQYTLKPSSGVKLSKITALDSNIALDLGAKAIRIEAPIPGKKAVGVEVPNTKSATVRISSVMASSEWNSMNKSLGFALGKDIAGVPVVAAIEEMPHLLIAGQTKAGKSVMINTLLTSLLYRNSPSDLKLILVDPKQVEMAPYADIPHLLTPVITEPEKTISALKWAVAEMERRYTELANAKKRNIADYNAVQKEGGMPYIVIVIDELADLMMMAARDVEALLVRIAQKARAVGIHLVLATQSPRATVITGLIKANIPARIAFTVSQELESRIILDYSGAEKLLGMGDMLFQTPDMPQPKRVQGAFITDEETNSVMDFLRNQRGPQYDDEVVSQVVVLNGKGGIVADLSANAGDSEDSEFRDAVMVVLKDRKASTSSLQRRLRIGYGKAARIIDQMEEQGIIGPADGSRPREVLISSMEEVFGGDNTSDEADITEIEVEQA